MSTSTVRVEEYYQGRYKLYVNDVVVGEYIYGENKKYLNPEKWADEQVPKRIKVLDRNIIRLKHDLLEAENEHEKLIGYLK